MIGTFGRGESRRPRSHTQHVGHHTTNLGRVAGCSTLSANEIPFQMRGSAPPRFISKSYGSLSGFKSSYAIPVLDDFFTVSAARYGGIPRDTDTAEYRGILGDTGRYRETRDTGIPGDTLEIRGVAVGAERQQNALFKQGLGMATFRSIILSLLHWARHAAQLSAR